MRLTQVAICTERHLALWKWVTGVVIRKPGKEDYMKLRDYHSVSQQSCMKTVVMKVNAKLLSHEAQR